MSANEHIPAVICSWPFGMAAYVIAWAMLVKGELSSLDAVEAGIIHFAG